MSEIVIERGWAGRHFAMASRTGDRSQFPIEVEQAGIMLKMHLSLLRKAIEAGELNGIPMPTVYQYFKMVELEAFCNAVTGK